MKSLFTLAALSLLLSCAAYNLERELDELEIESALRGSLYKYSDVIPDKKTALKIGYIILYNIYGDGLHDSLPLYASLYDDEIWLVKGTLDCDNCDGGVPYILLNKKDGRVIKYFHMK